MEINVHKAASFLTSILPVTAAGNESGTILLQAFDSGLDFRHQRVDFLRLAVEEGGDGAFVRVEVEQEQAFGQ